MPASLMRLIKNSWEFLPQEEITKIPPHTRGIYVLYKEAPNEGFEVVYIGMAKGVKTAGIAGRLRRHRRTKGADWTFFSVFGVGDNISEKEVEELEGLLRHIYQKDPKANALNKQRGYGPLNKIRRETEKNQK